MKFFTKQRLAVLAAAVLVIVVLLFGIITNALLANGDTPDPSNPVITEPEHEKVRTARVGLAGIVAWETNFGGTADEVPDSCYVLNEKLFVFGRNDSADLDFTRSGIFAARLSLFGTTELFANYTAESTVSGANADKGTSTNYKLKVALKGDGFLLAVSSSTGSSVIMIDENLKITSSLALKSDEACPYDIVDIAGDDDYFYIFRQSYGTSVTPHVICDVVTEFGTLKAQKVFRRTNGLTYMRHFPKTTVSGLTTALFEAGASSSCLTFAEWTLSGAPIYSSATELTPYRAMDIVPHDEGWLMLMATSSGQAFAAVLGSDLRARRYVPIDLAGAISGKLFYAFTSRSYYAAMYIEGELSALFNLGGTAMNADKINAPAFSGITFYGTATGDKLLVTSVNDVLLLSLDGNKITSSEICKNASNPIMMRTGNDFYMCFAAKKSASVIGDNFGGLDIAVIKIK